MESLEWIRVNPAGNITCLVLTKVQRKQYMDIAKKLLAMPNQDFEQVGFIVDETNMEMAGLEFCGNASRGFALWSAKKEGLIGRNTVSVKVSGIEKPLEVFVDLESNFTQASMPLPENVEVIEEGTILGCPRLLKVDLGGIIHFVVLDLPYSDDLFTRILSYGLEKYSSPAFGVMFVNSISHTMVPIVYVKDIETIYHEGSCGSGTVAAIIALAEGLVVKNSGFHCEIAQPKGSLAASLYKKDGIITKITIEGPVEIGPIERGILGNTSILEEKES